MTTRPIIVAGCLRSGFAYITQILRQCGRDIGHENTDGRDGVVAWWVGHRYDVFEVYENPIVLHQVRHPLDAITSMVPRMGKAYLKDITLHLTSRIHRAATLWYYLNISADLLCPISTYQIENLWENFPQWCEKAHIPWTEELEEACKKVPLANRSPESPSPLIWQQLADEIPGDLFYKIAHMAEWYGYDTSDINGEKRTICVS